MKIGKLLKYCQMTNEVNLPFLDSQNYNSENSIDGAKQVARALRQYMGLPKGPIHSMVELLENNGVIVFYRFDFPSKIEGFTIYPSEQFPYVFANADCQGEKIRMTLAHELGHIVMHKYETPTCEDEAWVFATEFLAPEDEFLNDVPGSVTNIRVLFPLKYKWKISVKAMVKKLFDIGNIPERTIRSLYTQLSPYGKTESFPVAFEKPKVVDLLLNYCKQELDLSIDSICDLMGFSHDEFESWYEVAKYRNSNNLRLVLNNS